MHNTFNPTNNPTPITIALLRASMAVLVLFFTTTTATAASFLTIGPVIDHQTTQLQLGILRTISPQLAAYIPLAIGDSKTTISPAITVTLFRQSRVTVGFTLSPEIDILSIQTDTESKLTYLCAATGLACAYSAPLGLGAYSYIAYRPTDTPLPRLFCHAGIMLKVF